MIEMDYKYADTEYGSDELAVASLDQLHYDLFLGDIILRINGADFGTNWGWVPIYDFAICFARLVDSLQNGVASVFDFTESEAAIEFKLDDHQVRVSANYTSATAAVDYDEFLDASHTFVVKVLAYLAAQYPSLKRNSSFAQSLEEFDVLR